MMVADLHGPHALIGHMAVGARDARPGVHSLAPHLELRMLRLQGGRPRLGVRPVLEPVLLVVRQNLISAKSLVPRIGQPFFRPLEVVLDVALPAHVRAHLLPRRIAIDVVVLHALRRLHLLNTFQKTGPGHAQLHRVRIVAIDTRDGMRNQRARLLVFHLIHDLEPLDEIAAAEFLVWHVHGCVAVHAGSRLLNHGLPPRERLVVEHEGMSALFPKVRRKRISGPHRLQARVLLEPRLGDDRARIDTARRTRNGLAAAVSGADLIDGASVAIVLKGKILSPDRRIGYFVIELDDSIERIAGFLLALKDIHQERR